MKHFKLFLFFLAACVIHILCVIGLLKLEISSFLIKSYVFLFMLYLVVTGAKYFLKKLKNKTPFHFLSINIFKIITCILFLLPTLKNKTEITTIYTIHFFIAYFIFLAIEIIENNYQQKSNNNQ